MLDIPEPTLVATDHVALSLACSCGCGAQGEFLAPPRRCAGDPGPGQPAYLLGRRHLPLERADEANHSANTCCGYGPVLK